jgi:hypothetical protein
MSDEILDEIHRYREAYAERFNYDVEAMFRDMLERQKSSGRKVVSYPPRLIEPVVQPTTQTASVAPTEGIEGIER